VKTISLQPLLWGDQLGPKWERRTVEIASDNFLKLHKGYTDMPIQTIKVTKENRFNKCKEFIYSHLRVKERKPTVVNFKPFEKLNGKFLNASHVRLPAL
jgi:hypothetical protein